MGFREAKRKTIEAIRDGRFEHERREGEGKNLLANGDVSVEEVVDLLSRCRGDQHETRPHHLDASQAVDIFRPTIGRERWYIKIYLIEVEGTIAVVISVHQ